MGEVYEADQEHPVRRRVAIKVIKAGFDTRDIIARFDSERQALALMNHSNIARVLDAGETDGGRPYFVMECVRGVPITAYCDTARLTNRERLDIFLQVCDGVQHAHQKGIIHRDLKPSNILVEVQDQTPSPKIIDFGLAKALSTRLTDHPVATEFGQLVGTPEYMSPEQAEMTALDVDTRTDIYALGVLLYQLLTGSLPFDSTELRGRTVEHVRELLRHREPLRPSTRVSDSGDAAAEIASNRQTDVNAVARQLRGDLDWITLKAMHKDRTLRYASASELAADLKRHLRHEPVLAGPPATSYRVRKFIRRHRVAVATSFLVLFALVAGIIGTTFGLVRARLAEIRAQEEADTANRVTEFLTNVFNVSDPAQARGSVVTARELLDRGSKRLEDELKDQPTIQARLMHTIGRVYSNLGLFTEAQPLLERALSSRRRGIGTKQDLARDLTELAWLYHHQGRLADADPLTREALDVLEPIVGSESLELTAALTMRAILLRDMDRYDEARPLFERALRIREAALGPDHVDVGFTLYHFGWLLRLQAKYRDAQQAYERALPILEKQLGPDAPSLAWCLNDLAVVVSELGDFERARSLYDRAIKIDEQVLGPSHPALASVLNNVGTLLFRMHNYREAGRYYEKTLHIRERALGSDHPDLAGVLHNLGMVSRMGGDVDAARRYYERALSMYERGGNLGGRDAANTLSELALLFARQGKTIEADRAYQRAVSIFSKTSGLNGPEVAYTQATYAAALGQTEQALEHLHRAVAFGYQQPIKDDPDLAALARDPRFTALADRIDQATVAKANGRK